MLKKLLKVNSLIVCWAKTHEKKKNQTVRQLFDFGFLSSLIAVAMTNFVQVHISKRKKLTGTR